MRWKWKKGLYFNKDTLPTHTASWNHNKDELTQMTMNGGLKLC